MSCKLVSGIVFSFLFIASPPAGAGPPANTYIGAEKCMLCHAREYDEWKKAGHAQILHKASDAVVEGMTVPEGYKREDISYVIGGFRWKTLFLDRNGYLITGKGKNQYDVKSMKWVDYLPGRKIPYDCGKCIYNRVFV